MRIDFYFCKYYLTGYSGVHSQRLFSITNDAIVKDTTSDIVTNTVVDNDFYVQDTGEFSCTVKFNVDLFNILFTKPRHPTYPHLSTYVIRVYEDDNFTTPFFDGAIKFSGNTISSDSSKIITFSAYNWLIFINDSTPIENSNAVDLRLRWHLKQIITGIAYPNIPSFNWLGRSYFRINEDLTPDYTETVISYLKLDETELSQIEPVTLSAIDLELTMKDAEQSPAISFVSVLPATLYTDDPTIFDYFLTLSSGLFSKTFDTLYYHVILGYDSVEHEYTNNKYEYIRFKCYNVTDFEVDFSSGEQIGNYTSLAGLKTILAGILTGLGVTGLQSETFNDVTYTKNYGLGVDTGVLFDTQTVGNDIISLNSFTLKMHLAGTPYIDVLKTENTDLLKKALFVNTWGLSVLADTFKIEPKSDFMPNSANYTLISRNAESYWNVETSDPKLIYTSIFDGIKGYNKVDPATGNPSQAAYAIPYLKYWLENKVNILLNKIGNFIDITTKEEIKLSEVVMIEDYPAPVKFRISEVSYNPERPNIRFLKGYNISQLSIIAFKPTITKAVSYNPYLEHVTMSAEPGAIIYYTYNALTEPTNPTIASTVYSNPIDCGYGYYKAIAVIGGIVSSVALNRIIPSMSDNVQLDHLIYAYDLFNKGEEPAEYSLQKYMQKVQGSDNIYIFVINYEFVGFTATPSKMACIRYEFDRMSFIGEEEISDFESCYYDVTDTTGIQYIGSPNHVTLIKKMLEDLGFTGTYTHDMIGIDGEDRITFTDQYGYNRNYNSYGSSNQVFYTGLKNI